VTNFAEVSSTKNGNTTEVVHWQTLKPDKQTHFWTARFQHKIQDAHMHTLGFCLSYQVFTVTLDLARPQNSTFGDCYGTTFKGQAPKAQKLNNLTELIWTEWQWT